MINDFALPLPARSGHPGTEDADHSDSKSE